MELGVAVGNVVISFVLMALAGVLFGWAIWRAGRWRGGWAMLAGWAIAVFIATALTVFQIHRTQSALGVTPEQQQRVPAFEMFFPLWATALGVVSLVLRRAMRRGADRFTPALAARSFGAWLLGALAFLVVFAVLDFASLIQFRM